MAFKICLKLNFTFLLDSVIVDLEIEHREMAASSRAYCISYADIKAAYEVVRPHVHMTPLMQCSSISKLTGKNIFLKTENLQRTGSFKIRGALNAVERLKEDHSNSNTSCVITHSSGNHGQALALAANLCGVDSYIVMPETAPLCKKEAVKGYGGNVVECLNSEKSREEVANQVMKDKGGVFIHASQNPRVIAGQGTIAIEILAANPDIDAIIAPVGGGGMISGIVLAAKSIKPSIKVYGAEPEEAKSCYTSKKLGKRTGNPQTPVTVADGVKVSIGENTWPIIRDLLDDVITVSEDEIKAATKLVYERAKLVIEPTSGVGIAAVMKKSFMDLQGNGEEVKNVAVVLCGGNCDLKNMLEWY